MLKKTSLPLVTAAVGVAAFAFTSGESLRAMPGPSGKLLLNIITASSTATSVGMGFSPASFAKIDPAPLLIPSADKQQQS
jgi:hypothetical protein